VKGQAMIKNEKYLEYQNTIADFLSDRHNIQHKMDDNRTERQEQEDQLRIAIVKKQDTTKIKQKIKELDDQFVYLKMEHEAFLNIDVDSVIGDIREKAKQEQLDQLIGYREQFIELEPQFEELRNRWMGLVEKASEIRHASINTQQRLIEICGTKEYFPAAGEQIIVQKGREKGMIFLDNDLISKTFERKGK
jgi:hypothetical protein